MSKPTDEKAIQELKKKLLNQFIKDNNGLDSLSIIAREYVSTMLHYAFDSGYDRGYDDGYSAGSSMDNYDFAKDDENFDASRERRLR